ncbi:STAS domain-containing protein [Aliiglaciecola sp. LCG003]|uniref:STAS domain-containing protein n=1 Tax=Aliiglaciecola sp. LCG003 TaxID=3053655 RepID=UPI0025748E66|nr:STAS domain-containing protein [Aliiglaciecola sp. LCG003]WJG08128.1 STAS domain-containing protein [Aliiglaciecola sp. LCG003]
MSVESQLSEDQKTLTIHMDEKFDFGKVQEFRIAFTSAPSTIHTIIVDLEQTEYMDSSALGMLLNMQKTMVSQVKTFRIVNSRPQVSKILKISRFDKKFQLS